MTSWVSPVATRSVHHKRLRIMVIFQSKRAALILSRKCFPDSDGVCSLPGHRDASRRGLRPADADLRERAERPP